MSSFIIGISGGTASGKSTLARKLQDILGTEKCQIISADDYYFDSAIYNCEIDEINFDNPAAIDIPLLSEHLKLLSQGESIVMPQYDFITHKRKKHGVFIHSKEYVIVEGLFLFNQALVDGYIQYRIFTDVPDDIRLIRRIRRDLKERERQLEDILTQYENWVQPMHNIFVKPNKRLAEIVIDTQSSYDSLLCDIVFEIKTRQVRWSVNNLRLQG